MSARTPPNDLDAERAVLGSIFIRPNLWPNVAAELWQDAFFLPAHRAIFQAMGELARRGLSIDPIAVANELRAAGELNRLEGGDEYLMQITSSVPTAENLSTYTSLVLTAANKRRLITICTDVMTRAYGSDTDEELVAALGAGAARIATGRRDELRPIGSFIDADLQEFERRRIEREKNREAIWGVRTGVPNLDRVLAGLRPTNLVVIAAEPGGGKTALGNQAAITLTVEDGGTALLCNLEMPAIELRERAYSRVARVNSRRLRTGNLDDETFRRLFEAGRALSPALLYIEDNLFSLEDIVAKAREWRARHPDLRAMLMVDYLQMMKSRRFQTANRAREIGDWCNSLKALAKELAILAVIISQFNREAGKNGPPTRKNLRDSGEIEQAADVILLLDPVEQPDKLGDIEMNAIIDKNRNGVCSTVRVHWVKRYYEFENGAVPNEGEYQLSRGDDD